MSVIDCLTELGFNAAEDFSQKKIDEVKLKNALNDFIKKQKTYNEACSLSEEFDFQGLVEYITHDLIADVNKRFFSVKSEERKKAQEEIVSAAVTYSKAKTDASRQRVARLISICLEIIRDFFRKKIPLEKYYLASEIVEGVKENTNEEIEAGVKDIKQEITDSKSELKDELSMLNEKMESRLLFSLDNAAMLAEENKYENIEANLNELMEVISLKHPLYPLYEFAYENSELKSVPKTKDALEKYPPKLHFSGSVRAGEHYFNDSSVDPLNYAYRHQCCLQIKVQNAIKLLGDKQEDPIQHEAEALNGREIVIKPPEFPKAFPCSIKVNDTVFYNEIMLRTQEIMDDGTYVISNKEQRISVYFELRVNINKLNEITGQENQIESTEGEKIDFKMGIKGATNSELLNYHKFMLKLVNDRNLHIYNQELGGDIFAGIMNFNEDIDIASMEEDIDFLERICTIEKYFNVNFKIPDEIEKQEIQCVMRISDLITKDKVEFTWSEVEFSGKIDENFREALMKMNDSHITLAYTGVDEICIFGAKFEVKYMRTYVDAEIQEFDRIKELVQYAGTSDEIKIKFRADENNIAYDTLKIPDTIGEKICKAEVCI